MGARTGLLAIALALAALVTPAGGAVRAPAARGIEVSVYFPQGGPGPRCDRVRPVGRMVVVPGVLRGAMLALLRGPTAAERHRDYGGWFSSRTAGMLRSVRIADGVAYVDFRDFRRIIPNASSSCGSALLLAQLNRTATQFATVNRAVYSFDGSRTTFYEWLQRSAPRAAASAPPVGPLPPGPVTTLLIRQGAYFAVTMPRQAPATGLVWRAARPVDLRVARPIEDADVGPSIVAVYRAVGAGRTRIVYALTKGETPKALAAIRYDVTVSRP